MIIEFDRSFDKSLDKIKDPTILRRLRRVIVQLENSPSLSQVPNIAKLTGSANYYRIRIGDYRVGFEAINSTTVRFIIIANRKNIYKNFP
jgi:mRNA interferase RelE/StbE